MPQSLARVLVHLVFSTRGRRPCLKDTVRPELCAYLATILAHSEHVCVRIGSAEDHVHIAFFLSRTDTLAKTVERLKVSSSKWIKTQGAAFARFAWQKGYAVFSVGLGDRSALVRYIDNQVEHHRKSDFQAEMRIMFAKYGVEFDEKFVWD